MDPPHNTSENPLLEWNSDAAYRSRSSEVAAHGLEALSTAASRDQYSFLPPPAPDHILVANSLGYTTHDPRVTPQSPPSSRHAMLPPESPSASIISANNNINFLLNPSNSMSPVIDPSLQSSVDNSTLTSSPTASSKSRTETKADQPVESDHEVAFLLRHFAEAPGQW